MYPRPRREHRRRKDLVALRLLLRRVGQHDAADGGLLLVEDLHDQAVTQRLQIHSLNLPVNPKFVTRSGTRRTRGQVHHSIRAVPRQARLSSTRLRSRVHPVRGCYKVVTRTRVLRRPSVRRMRGAALAAARPRGKPDGDVDAAEGHRRRGRGSGPDRAAGGLRGDGLVRPARTEAQDVRYVYTWQGERVFKVVSFFLAHARAGRIGEALPGWRSRWPGRGGCGSTMRPVCSRIAGSATWPSARAGHSRATSIVARPPCPLLRTQLLQPRCQGPAARSGRKTATIRSGTSLRSTRRG